jgi:hypothetical protein
MTDGSYAPAHMLVDGRLERAGRQTSPAQASSAEAEEEPDGLARSPSLLSATAAIIIIGDEIVSGKVADANTSFLCKGLHALGWAVRKVGGWCWRWVLAQAWPGRQPRLCPRCRRMAGPALLAAPGSLAGGSAAGRPPHLRRRCKRQPQPRPPGPKPHWPRRWPSRTTCM